MREEALRTIMYKLGIQNINKSGKWLNASCPFAPYAPEHRSKTDSNPSFGTGINNNGVSSFHCFTCGNHGIISTLVRRLALCRNANYKALELEADQADVDITFVSWDESVAMSMVSEISAPVELNPDDYDRIYPSVSHFQEAKDYLVSRGVKASAARKADLRYSISEKRIVFPVRGLDNKLYGFTGRTILKKEEYPVYPNNKIFPKVRDFAGLKKEFRILGAERWVKGKPVFIQEGLMGYAYLLQIGADEIFNIGTTMGALLTPHQASMLIEYGESVFLMYDNDPAGDKALFGLMKDNRHTGDGAIDKLKNHLPLFVPEWPENKIDPDQLTIEDLRNIRDNTPLYIES